MPESRLERNAASVSLSGVSVSTTPPTAGNTVAAVDERTDGTVIPAGKLRVRVLNMGFVEDGDQEADITVNGDIVQPGSESVPILAILDPVNNIFKYTPMVTIINNGGSRIRIITEE